MIIIFFILLILILSNISVTYSLFFLRLLVITKILFNAKNILETILRLEVFILIRLTLMVLSVSEIRIIFYLTFFTLRVIEARLGVGILIKIIRDSNLLKFNF